MTTLAGRTYTSYTDEERQNALALFLANGCNYSKTAKELGIPYPTIRHWVDNSDLVTVVISQHKDQFQKTVWATLKAGMTNLKRLIGSKKASVKDIVMIVNAMEKLVQMDALVNGRAKTAPANDAKKPKASAETKTMLQKHTTGATLKVAGERH